MTKVLIVEDEMPTARKLKHCITEIDSDFDVIDILDSVDSTIEYLQNNSIDLIFLDIHLADGNCFKIFDRIEVDTPIIFTTAYNQYALEAFKQVSVDYLLKPLEKEHLKLAIEKFKKIHQRELRQKNHLDLKELKKFLDLTENSKFQERFLVQYRDVIKTIKTSDISSFFSENKSVFIQTFEGKIYDINYTLEQLETKLDPRIYYRVNRKCIVHIDSVLEAVIYSSSKLKLNIKPSLPFDIIISTKKSPRFKQWLSQ